ncbi:hypothetical protein VULLAG_LOCUS14095 [Vulpes lagopus]
MGFAALRCLSHRSAGGAGAGEVAARRGGGAAGGRAASRDAAGGWRRPRLSRSSPGTPADRSPRLPAPRAVAVSVAVAVADAVAAEGTRGAGRPGRGGAARAQRAGGGAAVGHARWLREAGGCGPSGACEGPGFPARRGGGFPARPRPGRPLPGRPWLAFPPPGSGHAARAEERPCLGLRIPEARRLTFVSGCAGPAPLPAPLPAPAGLPGSARLGPLRFPAPVRSSSRPGPGTLRLSRGKRPARGRGLTSGRTGHARAGPPRIQERREGSGRGPGPDAVQKPHLVILRDRYILETVW